MAKWARNSTSPKRVTEWRRPSLVVMWLTDQEWNTGIVALNDMRCDHGTSTSHFCRVSQFISLFNLIFRSSECR